MCDSACRSQGSAQRLGGDHLGVHGDCMDETQWKRKAKRVCALPFSSFEVICVAQEPVLGDTSCAKSTFCNIFGLRIFHLLNFLDLIVENLKPNQENSFSFSHFFKHKNDDIF